MMRSKQVQCVLYAVLLAAVSLSVCFFAGCSCAPDDTRPSLVFNDDDFIKTNGDKLCRDYGEGAEVVLRGVNAGGLLVTENWMNAFDDSARDNKTINEIWGERFGKEATVELWETYRSNYWTEEDFANCAAMGINVIRLPFTYMTVDPTYHQVPNVAGQTYNFSVLDEFIAGAEAVGIYTILDLHGAYGSQNGKDHSGEVLDSRAEVTFYGEEGAENRQKTAALWSAIAEHYAGNPAVAGYDLLNEPGERTDSGEVEPTTTRHWDALNMFYDAVREKDQDHVVIIESCWGGADLPRPEQYGWENVMYSFHHYTRQTTDYDAHMQSMRDRLAEVESYGFGVPVQMGEFTCYSNEQSWTDTLALLNAHGWHWVIWTYKIVPESTNAWGIYNIRQSAQNLVSPADDAKETILAKFAQLRTVVDESLADDPAVASLPESERDAAIRRKSGFRGNAYEKDPETGQWKRNGERWSQTTAEIVYDACKGLSPANG